MYRGDIEHYEPQKQIRACTAVSEINNKQQKDYGRVQPQ